LQKVRVWLLLSVAHRTMKPNAYWPSVGRAARRACRTDARDRKAALRHKYAQPPQVLQSIDVRR
jgi:hypothetical protein